MFTWISANIGTILICLVLIVIVAAIIRSLIRDKKRGKSSCGAGCAHCAMSGSCHRNNKPRGAQPCAPFFHPEVSCG